MKMTKSIKENFNKILSIFILIQPVIDLVTGILIHNKINLTIGIIIRALFSLFIVYTCLFTYKRKKLLIPYLIIFIYSLLYIYKYIVSNRWSKVYKLNYFTIIYEIIKIANAKCALAI